jgi:hypothetical protein
MRTAIALLIVSGCYPELPRLDSDAQGPSDAGTDTTPDARLCFLPADLMTPTIGTGSDPAIGEFFDTPVMGPNQGKKMFFLGGVFGGASPVNGMGIEVVKPATGFATNQAYPFQMTWNPTVAYTTAAYLLGDYDQATGKAKQMLVASNGSITFTAIGETSGAAIRGSVSMTSFREVDQKTYLDLPGGCTSQFTSLTFELKQQ